MNEQMRCKYGTGGVDKKNSEGYPDPTAYEALTNIKKEDKIFRPLVYICSPYAGDVEKTLKGQSFIAGSLLSKEMLSPLHHTYYFLCIFRMMILRNASLHCSWILSS